MMEKPEVYHRTLKLMGNRFQLSAAGTSEEWAQDCIEAGIHEYVALKKS